MALVVTQWFPAFSIPVYKGVYQRKLCFGMQNHYWNGSYWLVEKSGEMSIYQHRPWRGLADKPKRNK